MPPEISLFAGADAAVSIPLLALALGVGLVLSLILRWHFLAFGATLTNREDLAGVFPFITLTTILIITVVKSSLALSLGLVGALSIVRFRTPIKEPEELAYLFVAIGIGLGLGANQTAATVVAAVSILAVMAVLKRIGKRRERKNLFLSLDWRTDEGTAANELKQLNELINKHVDASDLRRFDVRETSVEATYYVDVKSADKLTALTEDLRSKYPKIGVTFLDQSHVLSA